ncbi:MAG TPA: DNA polymerase IV [Patescibacteria group bacterium]|nr:DNA polymerase IV [Patescibacteria group bacterium]
MTDRIILHVDMNSYFATVEQQANPFLRGKPIAVTGSPYTRTVVGASSIEAKRYGVKTGMSFPEAIKLCPQIIRVVSDPDKYAETTKRFIKILERYTPLVEVFSIDEAYLDITDTADRFGSPVEVAKRLKQDIRRECGEWVSCSVGIAHNKLLAKLGGELHKPDGLTVITPGNLSQIYASTPIDKACGIGFALTPKLNEMGIKTLSQLGETPLPILVGKFGSYGYKLKDIGLGVDESEIRPYYQPDTIKSIGHQFTFLKDTRDLGEISRMLFKLSELVASRARAQGKLGKTLHLWFRSAAFHSYGRQITLPNHTQDGMAIYFGVSRIWQEAAFTAPIRLVGVTLSNLRDEAPQQLTLLPDLNLRGKIIEVMDRINDKFGAFTVQQASLLGSVRMKRNMNGYGSDFKRGKTELLEP